MSSATGRAEGRITIADVARQAGVSVPTVSKVLNGRDDVADDTRDLVSGVIASSGYRPLRRVREHRVDVPTVELVITDLTTAYALEVLSGAEAGAARACAGLGVIDAGFRNTGDRMVNLAPHSPAARIKRSTLQRVIGCPRRPSSAWTLRKPYSASSSAMRGPR